MVKSVNGTPMRNVSGSLGMASPARTSVLGKEYILVTYRSMFTLEMFLFQGVQFLFDLTVFAELMHSMMNKGFVSFDAVIACCNSPSGSRKK